ncbi:MAG: hypothetical protein LBC84_00760 [Prevotellaceae bacterium]|jgi:hypothetical protein|nr:hypothetical protein [Prevotellaceae bacterium]
MTIWWNSLDIFLKIMWGIAIPMSTIFIIQMIMTFVGMGDHGDATGDADVDADTQMPLHFFTFRNLVNFFLGFSWTGISFYTTIENKAWLTLLGVLMGLLLVAIVMLLLYGLSRAVQSGNIDIHSAIGRSGTAYYTIPAARNGLGKVQLSVQQAVREYDAITDAEQPISTGRMVRVTNVIDSGTLLVEPM